MLGLEYPAVMGVLNVTPDSFSDGGKFLHVDAAAEHAARMIDEGAQIIDVGGESTRPGAEPVSPGEEIERVIPVIERIREISDVPISVDTSTPDVMMAAAAAGANLINDVRALRRDGALSAAAEAGLPVCLMHMQGDPQTMQMDPRYDDLFAEIARFFEDRMEQCGRHGIREESIVLDPGFGFGKTPAHNLALVSGLARFKALGRPLLVGLSRKSTIGKVLEDITEDRLFGSIAGAVMAYANGASIIRVHDVGPAVQALTVASAIVNAPLDE